MNLILHGHPFSAFCQKAIIALYENATPFSLQLLARDDVPAMAQFAALWPLRRMPILVDGERVVMEATVIIEHLGLYHPGPVRLIPEQAKRALETRLMDRVFDNYVATPMQRIVFDFIRPPAERDARGVAEARALLQASYAWLEARLAERAFAAGGEFSLADCAAAPALFYADWVEPIGEAYPRLRAYRGKLLARPSVARAVDEARSYRPLFPPGAPDRD